MLQQSLALFQWLSGNKPGNRFLEMVDRQPDFSLGIENTSQVAPCYSKVWPCFNGFQVTSLSSRWFLDQLPSRYLVASPPPTVDGSLPRLSGLGPSEDSQGLTSHNKDPGCIGDWKHKPGRLPPCPQRPQGQRPG